MADEDRLENALLSVEMTCVFAVVGLICFAAGWVRHGVETAPETDESGPFGSDPIIEQSVADQPVIEPLPEWVATGLTVAVIVLLVAVALDVYLLLQDEDIRAQIVEIGLEGLDDGE